MKQAMTLPPNHEPAPSVCSFSIMGNRRSDAKRENSPSQRSVEAAIGFRVYS